MTKSEQEAYNRGLVADLFGGGTTSYEHGTPEFIAFMTGCNDQWIEIEKALLAGPLDENHERIY